MSVFQFTDTSYRCQFSSSLMPTQFADANERYRCSSSLPPLTLFQFPNAIDRYKCL
uniref:Uncharacterized protein n=1 Tax=Arion vulgaris TaxID=1028688 RepID=A0A0B6Z642_9EUPU